MAQLRRPAPERAPIDDESNLLVRFGERCNHACPMCTNSKRPERWEVSTREMLRRIDAAAGWGFRRVVLTGGEPTIHPGFFDVVERLVHHGILWDLNTHGRSFHRRDFATRAASAGLQRAVVSLHGHTAAIAAAMSGAPPLSFQQTLRGTAHLIEAGVTVTMNLVLSSLNLQGLGQYLHLVAAEFGTGVAVKLCFPELMSQGRDWAPVQLRLQQCSAPLRAAMDTASELGLTLQYESLPNCITGDPNLLNTGRLGFGETHYLDDDRGDAVYSIAYLESMHARFGPQCARCGAAKRCSGVSRIYAQRYGTSELVPFPAGRTPWFL